MVYMNGIKISQVLVDYILNQTNVKKVFKGLTEFSTLSFQIIGLKSKSVFVSKSLF